VNCGLLFRSSPTATALELPHRRAQALLFVGSVTVDSRKEGGVAAREDIVPELHPLERHLDGLRVVAAIGLTVFGLVGAAVSAGALASFDQAAVDHLFPIPGYPRALAGPEMVRLVSFPAYLSSATLLFAVALVVLALRGRRRAAYAFGAIWIVATLTVLSTKALVARPTLFYDIRGTHFPIAELAQSYPSGQATRAALLTAIVLYLWWRLLPLVAIWLCCEAVILVAGAVHLPSDVLGGLLLGGSLAAIAIVFSSSSPSRPSVDARSAKQRG
jgi:membrane-associated phospholipid phosphatase